jgi:RNA polymerase I-specific transcription initiation factor RRN7
MQQAPNTLTLHALASRLSKLLYSNYGIFTPEANAGPILWRVTEQALGGTRTPLQSSTLTYI